MKPGLVSQQGLYAFILLPLIMVASPSIAATPDDYASPIGKIDAEIRCQQDGRGTTATPSADERACLSKFRGIVTRSGDTLTFKLDDGKTKILQSNKKACEDTPVGDCIIYDLVGFIRGSHQFVVGLSLYESQYVELVSRRTGIVTKLEGYPHLSPNGKLFVTVAASDAWEIQSPIAIYANTDPPKLIWRFPEPREYEQYSFDGWDGEDRIILHTTTDPQIETDVRRSSDEWVLRRPNGKISSGTRLPPTSRPAGSERP